MNEDALIDALFAFYCRKYVQHTDHPRHRPMGLQYTRAETHDLAIETARFLNHLFAPAPLPEQKPQPPWAG